MKWSNELAAITYAFLGFFFFTLMDISIKWLLEHYSLIQVTFFNCLFAMLGLLVWIAPDFSILKTRKIKLHVTRALIVLVVDLLAFYSYGEVPLAEAYTLILTMPLFTLAFSVMFGLESFSPYRAVLSFIGFLGITLVVAPGFGHFEIALLAALASAAIEAVGFILVSHNSEHEPPQAFAFYGIAMLTVFSGCVLAGGILPPCRLTNGLSVSLAGYVMPPQQPWLCWPFTKGSRARLALFSILNWYGECCWHGSFGKKCPAYLRQLAGCWWSWRGSEYSGSRWAK
nr:DMT family transporter [Veronia nyctiphanis]